MLRITEGKGFQLDFPNGWTISVQFGGFNYCDNRDQLPLVNRSQSTQCVNAEVAIFQTEGDEPMDEPEGWVSVSDVAVAIAAAAAREAVVPATAPSTEGR